MDEQERVRENRLRRLARRRGLILHKSRVRDSGAVNFGEWRIIDREHNFQLEDKIWDLDSLEKWLDEYKVAR